MGVWSGTCDGLFPLFTPHGEIYHRGSGVTFNAAETYLLDQSCALFLGSDMSLSIFFFSPFFMSNVMQGYYIRQKSHGVRNLPVCDNLPESFRCWRGYRLKSKRLQITSIAHINLIVRWEEVDGVTLKSVPKDLVPFIFHKYVKRRRSCIVRGDKATERMFHSR